MLGRRGARVLQEAELSAEARCRTQTAGLSGCRALQPHRGRIKALSESERAKASRFIGAQAARSRPLATGRRSNPPEAHYELFRDWQRSQTQSSVNAPTSSIPQMDVRSCREQGPPAVRHSCAAVLPDPSQRALSRARHQTSCVFS